MSFFAHEVEALKSSQNLTATQLSKHTGVDVATLSRVKNGERNITFDDLRLICRAFPGDAARLLRARLLDECDIPGGNQIEISVVGDESKHHSMSDNPPPYHVPLPPAIAEAIQIIIANVGHDSKLRSTILFIGERLKITAPAVPQHAEDDTRNAAVVEAVEQAAPPPARKGRRQRR